MWRILLLLAVGLPAFALEEDWRVQRLNERFEDFYSRLRVEEEFAEKRQAAAKDVEKQRKDWNKEMEAARMDYIKNKPKPPDVGPAVKEWSEHEEKSVKEREIARRHYVDVKNHIEILERSAKKIDENKEYDLELSP
jgi:lipopolysaccharide biosynthesis regulator YciM